MNEKIYESIFLNQMAEDAKSDYYVFGLYSDYDGLDIYNIYFNLGQGFS
jgi:hypothetical protein